MPFSGGYGGPKEIHYLFIDGGCLRDTLAKAADKWFAGCSIDVDYEQLTRGFTKTFYYDCLPPQKRDERKADYDKRIQPNLDFFNHLRGLRGVHVFVGDTRHRRGQPIQKQVDVKIAVDMLTFSSRRIMHQSTLLTGDLDFKPLLDALVADGTFVNLWYPRGTTNLELVYAADASRPLDIRVIYEFTSRQFRDKFSIPDAYGREGKGISDYRLEGTWRSGSEAEVEVCRGSDSYLLVFPDKANPGYFTHVKFGDLELLKAYVEEVHFG
ncbi:MAG TPA: NYN domain-containing protein [Aggregatilineaceae bacterium]|nr:NYN domain-containing protein [Aggregatilineaceae bacterium]